MCRPAGCTFEDMCSLMVYFFAKFSCLRYGFQPHSKLCVLSGYTISRFLIVFYVLSGSGSGSPGGTTPKFLSIKSFYQRTINDWNNLSADVVDVPSLNAFKNRLDEHWKNSCYTTTVV